MTKEVRPTTSVSTAIEKVDVDSLFAAAAGEDQNDFVLAFPSISWDDDDKDDSCVSAERLRQLLAVDSSSSAEAEPSSSSRKPRHSMTAGRLVRSQEIHSKLCNLASSSPLPLSDKKKQVAAQLA